MLAIGVEGGAMAGVEMRRILHHPHGRLDRFEGGAALAQDRPAGAQGTGQIGTGRGPFGLGEFGFRQSAAAAMDGESEGHWGAPRWAVGSGQGANGEWRVAKGRRVARLERASRYALLTLRLASSPKQAAQGKREWQR